MDAEKERIRALLLREMVERGLDPDETPDIQDKPDRKPLPIYQQYIVLIAPIIVIAVCGFFGYSFYQSNKQAKIDKEEANSRQIWKSIADGAKAHDERVANTPLKNEEEPPLCRPGSASYTYEGCLIYKENTDYARRMLENRK